jgi:uncharacterized protein YcbK (DUF882 family)
MAKPLNLPKGLTYNKQTRMIEGTFQRNKDWKLKISPHFRYSEFRSLDNSNEIKLDLGLVNRLERLREASGNRPIFIQEGYRTPDLNFRFNDGRFLTAGNDLHSQGKAVDIRIKGLSSFETSMYANSLRTKKDNPVFKGLVFSETTPDVHLDIGKFNTFGTFQSGRLNRMDMPAHRPHLYPSELTRMWELGNQFR